MADGSPAIVDDYRVFELELSGAAIWQGPGIILTDLGSGHSTASTCSRRVLNEDPGYRLGR